MTNLFNNCASYGFAPCLFYAKAPEKINGELYPFLRQEEIEECNDKTLKLEKFYAWKLLEIAVKEHIGLDFNKINFEKSSNGKWFCDRFCFSISHSAGVVAVCVSEREVGVDCQEIKPVKAGIESKILTAREKELLSTLEGAEREEFLLSAWCKKECLLKHSGEGALNASNRETVGVQFFKEKVEIDEKSYFLFAYGEGIAQDLAVRKIEF
jgi:phosphopantetheinyl transferase